MENQGMSNCMIKLQHVEKVYGENKVVQDLSLDIYEGEFITLLGPSGCGKTTTLRMIAGFEQASSGTIFIDGVDVIQVPPYKRNVNTVFQSYALFPHLNLFDNIAFGLVEKGMKKDQIKEKVQDALELVQLRGFEKRRPNQISGGQKQRVAIARALVNNPKVLLLDEPLGALDLKLRKQMQEELKQLQKKLGITFLYVTHDQEEALTMSDRIVVMNHGIVEQIGTAKDIYEKPASKFVAEFIGESNLLEGYVEEILDEYATIVFESGKVRVSSKNLVKEEMIDFLVRPEDLCISLEAPMYFECPGQVQEIIYIGLAYRVLIRLLNGQILKAILQKDEVIPQIGAVVYLSWKTEKAVILHDGGNELYDYIDEVVVPEMEGE